MNTHARLIEDIDSCIVPAGRCAFWWLGQHSFVLKLAGSICYIDPYLSPSPQRLVPPMLDPSAIAHADLVLGTHDHLDHIDRAILPAVLEASPQAKLIVPELNRQEIVRSLGLADERVLGIDIGIKHDVAGLTITAVPAAHEFLNRDATTGLHPFLGYVIEADGFRAYHAGDTCLYEGMQSILRSVGPIDLAFLPINGRDGHRYSKNVMGNLTYQEAGDLAASIAPGMTVPTHYDMFAGNTQDPQAFLAYLHQKYPALLAQLPEYGKAIVVSSRSPRI